MPGSKARSVSRRPARLARLLAVLLVALSGAGLPVAIASRALAQPAGRRGGGPGRGGRPGRLGQ